MALEFLYEYLPQMFVTKKVSSVPEKGRDNQSLARGLKSCMDDIWSVETGQNTGLLIIVLRDSTPNTKMEALLTHSGQLQSYCGKTLM